MTFASPLRRLRPDGRLRSLLGRWSHAPRVRRLRLAETLALGERRLVAIVRVDGREFLVGATPHTVALLSELGADTDPGGRRV